MVVWAPGNHELWTPPGDAVTLRGEQRYRALVRMCRDIGVHTPEDPYPVWTGADGPVVVAVYGHLHIPRTTHYDGVRFEEVSLGYPREWGARADPPRLLRRILGGAA